MKKLLALLLIPLSLSVAQAQLGAAKKAKDGRLFYKLNAKSDSLFLKANGAFVYAVPAEKPTPLKDWSVDVKIDINTELGTVNAQGQPADLGVVTWRYAIDDQPFPGAIWQVALTPGTHQVTVQFDRPGYLPKTLTRSFVIPPRPGTGAVAPPVKPTPVKPTPKPDETRLEGFTTDEGAIIQPAGSKLRRVPRLVLPALTRTLDPDFGSIPPFEAPSGLVTIYQDAGSVEEAKSRGWKTFNKHGLPGIDNMTMLYNNIFEDGDTPDKWTKFRQGIADERELPDLINRALGAAGGWRGPDGKIPAYIAFDSEIKIQPGQEDRFYRIRGKILQALRSAYPASRVGHYGGQPQPSYDGPLDFHMVGDYTVLNVWDPLKPGEDKHIDAVENPALWTAVSEAYGEWAFQKVMEGRKAQATRSQGLGLMAFWNLFRDGGMVPGKMSVRDDVAEGSLLLGILGGMEGVWPWNAHDATCQTPGCVHPKAQVLTGTRAITAALWRLSQPEIREMLDGNQTYFLPAVSTNGATYTPQTGTYAGGARPAAYASIQNRFSGASFWAYEWPDDLPVVVGIRNRGKVALAAVFPREQNPDALRQVWVKDGDFSDTFILKGRNTDLFTSQ